jgi:MFS family permease
MSRRLSFVLLAIVAAQAAQYIVRPLTSYRLLALGAGPRDVGLVTAAFAVVPVLVAIPLGRLADSRRSAPLVVAGAATLAVASDSASPRASARLLLQPRCSDSGISR